ncbi:hypothetical protein HJG60_011068 [Phyllostomus discolor]|uniref:Uncharacterized protein n=1 Tax=Phyllostomus discolor TaxID=89673 RepID=A0A834AEH9_9CHIR|nr:hypothetical protein HJG60_011068 [Phyllostomus discolor]
MEEVPGQSEAPSNPRPAQPGQARLPKRQQAPTECQAAPARPPASRPGPDLEGDGWRVPGLGLPGFTPPAVVSSTSSWSGDFLGSPGQAALLQDSDQRRRRRPRGARFPGRSGRTHRGEPAG